MTLQTGFAARCFFGFLQMALLLNKFAHPRFILCVKKREWKSIAANKAHFLQPMLRRKVRKCAVPSEHLLVKFHLAHLQHSKTLEKHENKEKLSESNV